MPFPRTPKSDKKKKPDLTPIRKQLEEQLRRQTIREMEEKLKALVQQRGAVKGKLTRVKTAVAQREGMPNPNLRNVNFLKLHLETVKSCYSEFNGFQNEIYALPLSEEQNKEQDRKYEEFEMLYNELVIQLSDLLDEVAKPAASTTQVHVPPANVVVSSYLPPLSVPLPTFDGTYETWFAFKSMFQNVMARYQSEAPAIKLYHLRNSLIGKAAGIIDQDIINNNDYDAAWAILQERYEDKRVIIDKHIGALFSLPKTTSDSSMELRKLVDSCVKHIEGLKSLELPVNGLGEQMVVNLIASKMDREMRKAWESTQKAGVMPSYEATITFLKEQCRILERLEQNLKNEESNRAVALVIAGQLKCSFCRRQHDLSDCLQLKVESLNEKYNHLRKNGLCFNCTRHGHRAAECEDDNGCEKCNKRHHTMLHPDRARQNVFSPDIAAEQKRDSYPRSLKPGRTSQTSSRQVVLPTAVVLVHGPSGEPHRCRALIDSCSQKHFVSERFADLLATRKQPTEFVASGLNCATTKIRQLIKTTVRSRVGDFSSEVELMITPSIIEKMPHASIDISSWKLPRNIQLADPNFNENNDIDMLLGAELFWDLIKSDTLKLQDDLPVLRNTELGWIVGGALTNRPDVLGRGFCGVIKHKSEGSVGRVTT